jgi:hypothetical protein
MKNSTSPIGGFLAGVLLAALLLSGCNLDGSLPSGPQATKSDTNSTKQTGSGTPTTPKMHIPVSPPND